MRLDGKVAVVTGSSKGIGRAIAVRFAREGADVLINYSRSADQARETLQQVERAGRRGHLVQADLSRIPEIDRLIAAALEHFGRFDILVNNAGIEKRTPFLDVSEQEYDQVLNLNLKGAFFATQRAARHWVETDRPGKVINISSVHEELSFPGFASYCASKGGLGMLTRTLAVELAPRKIAVNGIAPGAIDTPINQPLKEDPDRLQDVLDKIPLRRLGRPEDVAAVAAFLASSEADYVTGATWYVDGGLLWNYEE